MFPGAISPGRTVRLVGTRHFAIASLALFLLSACEREAEAPPPEVRPVRTVTIVKRETGETVSYTGRIEAETETRLAFRICGRMIERRVNVGDQCQAGQVGGQSSSRRMN